MEFISLTPENLDQEHICCSISDKKSEHGVRLKKAWLAERMNEGLKFIKLDARGKVFIECIPAEKAWSPVEAPGYSFINCHWVSGSYKGKGYGSALLRLCTGSMPDSNGLVAVASAKKMPFLSDGNFLKRSGFVVCDTAPPYFELMVLKTNPGAATPRFLPHVKNPTVNNGPGIDLYYTHQCPFAPVYAEHAVILARDKQLNIRVHLIGSTEEARKHPVAWTTYSLFRDGRFITHKILTMAGLEALAANG